MSQTDFRDTLILSGFENPVEYDMSQTYSPSFYSYLLFENPVEYDMSQTFEVRCMTAREFENPVEYDMSQTTAL